MSVSSKSSGITSNRWFKPVVVTAGALVVALILVLPTWPHSRRWGYGPTGLLAFLVVATLVLMLVGVVPRP